jgi:putative sterol carrier protein
MNVVKCIALVLALVAALALGSVAWAASEEWAGRFAKGGDLNFKLTIPGKLEQRKVKRWEWNNFKIRCRNGKHKYDGKFTKDVEPVTVEPTERTFEITAVNSWGGKAIVNGTFDKSYAMADGTFKIKGRTGVGRKCRGESDWTAAGPQTPPPPP